MLMTPLTLTKSITSMMRSLILMTTTFFKALGPHKRGNESYDVVKEVNLQGRNHLDSSDCSVTSASIMIISSTHI
jgi:hypothetical protein